MLILQTWPVKPCKNQMKATMFEEQSFDQSAPIKLTEELLRTKGPVIIYREGGGGGLVQYEMWLA